MTIVKEYLELTDKWKKEYGEKSLVLMQVGSFFEVYGLLDENGNIYGSNILDFASINDMHVSKKNVCVGNNKVVMAGFGLPQLEKYVKKLQENGYVIIVYTQDTQAKNTTRSLNTIFSPGTYFSNDTSNLSNNIMCVWIHDNLDINKIKKLTFGITNIDIFTGKVSIFECTNDFLHNPTTYDELERYLSIYKPIECILIYNIDTSYINDIINFVNLDSVKILKLDLKEDNEMVRCCKNSEKQKYQEELLNRFYSNTNIEILYNNLQNYCISVQSLVFLLDYIFKHNPNLINKISEPIFENYSNRLILANHTLQQLNIIPDNRYSGKNSCVLNLLNNCITPMGKRKFQHNLLNPIVCEEELNKSYDITDYLINEKNIWKQFKNEIGDIKDIEKLKRKLLLNKISPKDFTILFKNLELTLKLLKIVEKNKTLQIYFSSFIDLKKLNFSLNEIKKEIKIFLDLKICENIDDFGGHNLEKYINYETKKLFFINKGVYEDLDLNYKKAIDTKEQLECVQQYLGNLIVNFEKNSKNNNLDFIKIHETAKSDPILMTTKRRATLLKKEIDNILKREENIELKYKSEYSKKEEIYVLNLKILEFLNNTTNSNIIISSKELKEIYSSINSSKNDLINILEKYFTKFILKISEYDFSDIISFITNIDILQCKCFIAKEYNYCKPVIVKRDKSFFNFKGLRHSLIEHINKKELYVTNDLKLGDKETDGILLYGTNAVGKTSFIKAIGIALILAQSGLYVPANNFEFYPYKSIFTRILGSDNIFKGLSTFAVEMSELRSILEVADENSLILGDELCSGTENDSALSIFVAGLEELNSKKCTYLFATHFHEIVKYEEIVNLEKLKMLHMQVKYDNINKKLIYDRKLKEGSGDSMYGLEVCKSLSLPSLFLDRAHELRIKYNNIYKNILSEKVSKYNSDKIKGNCEICRLKRGSEIHHLEYKKNSKNNYINNEDYNFNVNHVANLINICEDCHNLIHKNNIKLNKTKRDNSYELL